MPRNVTTIQDKRHLIRADVMDQTGSSKVGVLQGGLRQRSSPYFEDWIRDPMTLSRLQLPTNRQILMLPWAPERCHCCSEWQNVVFLDESLFIQLWPHAVLSGKLEKRLEG